jgi:hypothetical protein
MLQQIADEMVVPAAVRGGQTSVGPRKRVHRPWRAGSPITQCLDAIADVASTAVVARPEHKIDAVRLVKGNAAFADDVEIRGLLRAKALRSPHAHAASWPSTIRRPASCPACTRWCTAATPRRVMYATGGQSWPNPYPWDQVSFDDKVRHLGGKGGRGRCRPRADRRRGVPAGSRSATRSSRPSACGCRRDRRHGRGHVMQTPTSPSGTQR